jgi:ribosomal protein S18 acetylase RimI-like enzyme
MTEYVAIRMLRSSDVEDWLSSSLVIGAYVGGRIVGMIGLKRELGDKHEHKGFMWGFYVERDYRKQGVGRVLLAALLDAAKKHVEQIMLTVVENNTPAIALYEQVG